LVVGGAAGAGASYLFDRATDPATPASTLPGERDLGTTVSQEENGIGAIAAATLPSVVSVEALTGTETSATGTGFVIREDGYLLTNNHVIAGGDGGLRVVFSDGKEYPATLVGATSEYDLAVLKVELTGLVPLVLGDSDAVGVGDAVIAVGSPLGLDATVTSGIVSALHRPVTAGETATGAAFIDAIQTDAAINPGNSGGPLLNSRGEVIGVNSAVAALPGATAQTGAGSVGLGFAIPSNQARRTADELIETGKATYPVIGVVLDGTYTGRGVMVQLEITEETGPGVVEGSPADLAGIKPGDVIIAIDGRPVTRVNELVVAIRAKAPGDAVVFTVLRDEVESEVSVTLVSNEDVGFPK